MSLHPSSILDEVSNRNLVEEMQRRLQMAVERRCDYCYRPYTSEPCKYPDRHSGNDNIMMWDFVKIDLHEKT